MTGDGANDAPALSRANVGIAVEGATDAARGAADIVLTEPGLSTMCVLFCFFIIHLLSQVLTLTLASSCLLQRSRHPRIPSHLPEDAKLRHLRLCRHDPNRRLVLDPCLRLEVQLPSVHGPYHRYLGTSPFPTPLPPGPTLTSLTPLRDLLERRNHHDPLARPSLALDDSRPLGPCRDLLLRHCLRSLPHPLDHRSLHRHARHKLLREPIRCRGHQGCWRPPRTHGHLPPGCHHLAGSYLHHSIARMVLDGATLGCPHARFLLGSAHLVDRTSSFLAPLFLFSPLAINIAS
jgi:hypothetical protein